MQKILLFLSSLFLLAACKKTGGNDNNIRLAVPVYPQGDSVDISSYPLHTGNAWTYTVQYQSSAGNTLNAIQTATYKVSIVYDTILAGYHVFRFEREPYTIGGVSYSKEEGYYMQNSQGLYILPSIAHLDSSYVNDSAQLLLRYPAADWRDSTWGASVYSSVMFSGYKKLGIPAGMFNCVYIVSGIYSRHAGSSGYNESYRYYAEKGLIQSVDIADSGEAGGSIVQTMIKTLTSVNF